MREFIFMILFFVLVFWMSPAHGAETIYSLHYLKDNNAVSIRYSYYDDGESSKMVFEMVRAVDKALRDEGFVQIWRIFIPEFANITNVIVAGDSLYSVEKRELTEKQGIMFLSVYVPQIILWRNAPTNKKDIDMLVAIVLMYALSIPT